MAIEPNYIYYSKRIVDALLNNPINSAPNISREAILFHQLNEKAVSLKSALGLLENTVSFYQKSEPTYQVTEPFSIANDLRESLINADKANMVNAGFIQDVKAKNEAEATQGVFTDLTFTDTDIINKPDKISAAVFINGLDQAFNNWTKDPKKGGLAPTGEQERTIVDKYQQELAKLKGTWSQLPDPKEDAVESTGGGGSEGKVPEGKASSKAMTEEQAKTWYESLYAIPGKFITDIKELQTTIHTSVKDVMNLEGKKPTAEEISELSESLTSAHVPDTVTDALTNFIGKKVSVEMLTPLNKEMINYGQDQYPNVNKISIFWQDLMGVYDDMLAATYPGVEDLSSKISANVDAVELARECITRINNFVTSLHDFLTVAWTQPGKEDSFYGNARYGSLVDNYMLMGGLLRLLADGIVDSKAGNPGTGGQGKVENLVQWPTEVNAALKTFLDTTGGWFPIGRVETTMEVPWARFMGGLFVFQACARGADANRHNQELGAEQAYWASRNDNAFVNAVLSEVKKAKDAYDRGPGSFSKYSFLGIKCFVNSTLEVNPRFLMRMMDMIKNDTTISLGGLQQIKDAGTKAITSINEFIQKKEKENATLMKQKDRLDPSKMNYAVKKLEYQKTFVDTTPLETTYVSLLLDKYFPEQNHILKLIGKQMVFSNRAAKELNKIIQDITSFQASDVYYSLSMYLRQMNLQAIANAKGKAEAVRQKELERANVDLTRCDQVAKKIDNIVKEIQSIKPEDDPDPVKKQEFLYKLGEYKNQILTVKQNLYNLKAFLKGMTFEDLEEPDSTDKAFKVSIYGQPSETWLRQLAILESFVIEGGNKGEVPGGEQQFLKTVEAEQQNYTTFNQNQQLALQMETAAIQQEWMIVTTGLGLLNQMFSKIIRRIKS